MIIKFMNIYIYMLKVYYMISKGYYDFKANTMKCQLKKNLHKKSKVTILIVKKIYISEKLIQFK